MHLVELDRILFGFNALVYIVIFAWYWYKDRCLNLRTFITMLYAGSAIFAPYVYCAMDPNFYNGVLIEHLTFFPFLYLLAVYMLILSPLLHKNIQNIQHYEISNPKLLNVLTWVVVAIYVVTIATSSMIVTDLFSIEKLLQNYIDTVNNTIDGYRVDVGVIERVTSILKGATTDIVILLLIFHLINNNKIGIIAMLACMGYNILFSLSIGQRAGILEVIFSVILIYFIVKNTLTEKVRRRLSISLVFFGILTIVAFGMLTFARFSERDNSIANYVLTYYSESWYIFNNHGIDPGGCRYGDFTAPLVRRLMGQTYTQTMFESIDTFTTMRTNCSIFNTVVGDFTMDYGAIWTALLFIGYALLMHHAIRGTNTEEFPFEKLIIIIIAWRIASIGFIAFSYRGIGGNLQLVTDIILYFILKHRYVINK